MRAHLLVAAALFPHIMNAQAKPIVIHADRVLDGRGRVMQGAVVVVDGAKITSVGASNGAPVTYDLKGKTLIPGLIDVNSHLTWYYKRQGGYHAGRGDNDTPVESMLSTVG